MNKKGGAILQFSPLFIVKLKKNHRGNALYILLCGVIDMKGHKTHRHGQNPKEKEIHDLFVERFCKRPEQVERIVLPIDEKGRPNGTLSDNEIELIITAMQWIGSPVGQSFLQDCGFVNAT